MREERIGPEGAFRRELRRLFCNRLERLPAEAVGARLRNALRDAAGRRRPCELLVVCSERGAAVLAGLLLAAEERVRYITEQCGGDAGEEEAFHGLPGCPCEMQLQDRCSEWSKGLPGAVVMLQTSGWIVRGRDASEDNWWRQRWARIEAVEAVEAVEAIEKLF